MRYVSALVALLAIGCVGGSRGPNQKAYLDGPACTSGAPECPDGLVPSCAEDCAQEPVCHVYEGSPLASPSSVCVREVGTTRVYSPAVCVPAGC